MIGTLDLEVFSLVSSFDCQHTLAEAVVIEGVGLHSGTKVSLRVSPASADSGISFIRSDIASSEPILAEATNIVSTKLCTVLGLGDYSVATVEHLMAAFYIMNIDNAVVELNGPEVPIMDGSAFAFLKEFRRVGLRSLNRPRSYFTVLRPFEVRLGDQFLKVEPSSSVTKMQCTINFEGSVIGKQTATYIEGAEDERLTSARTFCHINDVNSMRQQGLARGGSLDNAIVVSDTGVINEGGLRSVDEFAQHKMLDMLGDLYLLGRPILGHVVAHKPGHTLHAAFAMKVLAARGVLGVLRARSAGFCGVPMTHACALG